MTTKLAAELAAGVPAVEAWRLVEASDPGLVTAWRAARATFDRHEPSCQARAADWRRRAGSTARRPESPYGRALREAREAVELAVEDLLVSGRVVYAGHRGGQFDGGPDRPVIAKAVRSVLRIAPNYRGTGKMNALNSPVIINLANLVVPRLVARLASRPRLDDPARRRNEATPQAPKRRRPTLSLRQNCRRFL